MTEKHDNHRGAYKEDLWQTRALMILLGLATVCTIITFVWLWSTIQDTAALGGKFPISEILRAAVLFALVAIPATGITIFLWRKRIADVLMDFRMLLVLSRSLDFTDKSKHRNRHEAIDLAVRWRRAENKRFAKIKQSVADLVKKATPLSADEKADTQERLTQIRSLLD